MKKQNNFFLFYLSLIFSILLLSSLLCRFFTYHLLLFPVNSLLTFFHIFRTLLFFFLPTHLQLRNLIIVFLRHSCMCIFFVRLIIIAIIIFLRFSPSFFYTPFLYKTINLVMYTMFCILFSRYFYLFTSFNFFFDVL